MLDSDLDSDPGIIGSDPLRVTLEKSIIYGLVVIRWATKCTLKPHNPGAHVAIEESVVGWFDKR